MPATFRPNRAGLREYLKSTELYPPLERVAAPIEARAKASAPVESAEQAARFDRSPGQFRDSIHTERHVTPSRVTVRVVADSEAAVLIERRYRTLGSAAG